MKPVLLVVLGHAEQRALVNGCLRGAPYRLVFAADGEDGFDRFKEVQPDLVLTHLKTAKLDGTILCHLIVQESQGSVGVVLYGDEPYARGAQHAEAVGARAYVPVEHLPERLPSVLARTLAEPARPPARAVDLSGGIMLPMQLPPADGPQATTDDDPFAAVSQLGYAIEEGGEDDIPTSETTRPIFDVIQSVRIDSPVPDALPPPTEHGSHAKNARMIEEPPLPVNAMGPAMPVGSGGHTGRAYADDLIQELPREITPSDPRPRQNDGAGRQRKGLDESQLGKRLVRRVHQVHQLLDTLDHYQLLGVEPNATPAQLRAAYFELSLEFHPDRFFLLRSGDTKAKIYAIFRRVSEAYAVLSDERRRAMYDDARGAQAHDLTPHTPVMLSAPPPPRGATLDPRLSAPEIRLDGVTAHAGARRYVQLASVALKTDDLDHARLLLALAVGLDPQNASLRRVFDGLGKRRSRATRLRWGEPSEPGTARRTSS